MSQPQATELPFEQALIALERVVRELEEGNLGLDEVLTQYEQGVGLIKRCYGELRRAEQRILLMTGADENGEATLKEFKHEATAAVQSEPAKRVRRRANEIE